MSTAAKQKGYRGEVEVISFLATIMAEVYREMGLGPAPELARSPNGRDIRGIPWIAIEVKRHEPPRIPGSQERRNDYLPGQVAGWWAQCKTNTLPGQESVLIYRKNHSPWEVRMFGILPAGKTQVRTAVDISIGAFTTWFRHRLISELTPKA